MRCAARFRSTSIVSSLLAGGLLLSSCNAVSPNATSESASESTLPSDAVAPAGSASSIGQPEAIANQPAVPVIADLSLADAQTSNIPEAPQPQLLKTAELVLNVESIETSVSAVTAIARQQQGDVLGLQNQIPQDDISRHTASLQLRVPQARLDASLTALAKLGTVQQQSIAATDVSNQLVDFEARLRNLRRAEETVLKIMERSGNVADVLKVAQELNTIRASTEQIDAQLKDLQNRVAYSTIALSLQEEMASAPPQREVSTQLQETWNSATRSIGNVTVDLLQLGIWLIVYSPYLLLIAGAATLGYWRSRRLNSVANAEPQE